MSTSLHLGWREKQFPSVRSAKGSDVLKHAIQSASPGRSGNRPGQVKAIFPLDGQHFRHIITTTAAINSGCTDGHSRASIISSGLAEVVHLPRQHFFNWLILIEEKRAANSIDHIRIRSGLETYPGGVKLLRNPATPLEPNLEPTPFGFVLTQDLTGRPQIPGDRLYPSLCYVRHILSLYVLSGFILPVIQNLH